MQTSCSIKLLTQEKVKFMRKIMLFLCTIASIQLSAETTNAKDDSQEMVIHFDNKEIAEKVIDFAIKRGSGCCAGTSTAAPAAHAGPSFCPTTVTPAFFDGQIKAVDLSTTSSPGYLINTPGTYYIANDLLIAPTASPYIFIEIATSNVLIYMNSKAVGLSSSSSTQASTQTAFQIDSGVSNITIFGGDINQINGYGIDIQSEASGIVLHEIGINGCDAAGIRGTEVNNLMISNISCTNSTSPGGASDAIGMTLTTCKNCNISNSSFSNNIVQTGGTGDGIGVLLTTCNNCKFTNCTAGSNRGADAYGFRLLSSCNSITFESCSAQGNASTAGDAEGFSINASRSITLNNCMSSSTSATGTTSAMEAKGFSIDNTDCAIITNSIAMATTTTNNTGTARSNAYGFAFTNTSNGAQVCCCKALCTQSTNTTYGFFFEWSNNNTVHDSLSQDNTATGSSRGSAYGFFSYGGKTNKFENCKAVGNLGAGAATGGLSIGAGFAFTGQASVALMEQRSSIIGCEARGNGTPLATGEGYGIKFGDTTVASTASPVNCVVRNCTMVGNLGGNASTTASSTIQAYGFKDFGDGTSTNAELTSFLANNLAFAHRASKTFPLSAGQISDNFQLNYMFQFFNSGERATNMIIETDISTLTTLDTAGPYTNTSIYER